MGKTESCQKLIYRKENHPRIYGEDLSTVMLLAILSESPPYIWGRSDGYILDIGGVRITPVYMGKILKKA